MIRRDLLVLLATTLVPVSVQTAFAQTPGVEVRSGAVGEEHRREMMDAYQNYNLHLAFAEQGGAFIADVDVTIRDAHGRAVWSGSTEGPYLFAQLPHGRYLVQAHYEGRPRRHAVVVGPRAGTMHYLYW